MEVNIEEIHNTSEVRIAAVGVGGGGCNTINHLIKHGVEREIKLISLNTDAKALQTITAHSKIQLGEKTTRGFGAGMDPEIGRKSAEESYEQIKDELQGMNIVLIATGLGGGTGTGASPVVARAAKEVGALTIAVVTKPFAYEGKVRERAAEDGLRELKKEVDTYIVIPNEKLLSIIDKSLGMKDALKVVDDVMAQAVRGIASFILKDSGEGMNIDFADLTKVMLFKGLGLIGIGEKDGEDSAVEAVKEAIESPLFDNVSIKGAKGAIIHYIVNEKYPLQEMTTANAIVQQQLDENAFVKHGWSWDNSLEPSQVKVTLVITGFEKEVLPNIEPMQDYSVAPTTPTTPDTRNSANISDGSMSWAKYKNNKMIVCGTRNYPVDGDDIDSPIFLLHQQD